ncbi:MAG: helix-turn-helix transcriptional regulator [Halopenitus sp.]
MPRAALLVTILILVAAVGAGVTGTGAATAGSESMGSEAAPTGSLSSLSTAGRPGALAADGAPAAIQQSFDRSVVRIRVNANGSARWTFRYKRTLETEQEREDFAAYAEEFNENETALYDSFKSDAKALVAEGSNQTGRNMTATNFARNAGIESSLGNDVGVVELSFTWESFAVVDGDRVVVGDVFEGGLYVGPDQELVFVAGDGLVFESVAPNGTQSNPESLRKSDTVTWTGEQQFTDQRPRVVLVPKSAATATESESGAASTPATTPSETSTAADAGAGDGGTNWLPLFAAALITLVGAGWYRGQSETAGSPLAAIDPRSTDGGSAVGAGEDRSPGAAAHGDDPGTEPATGAGADGNAAADTSTAPDTSTAADAGTAAAGSAATAASRTTDGESASEEGVPDETADEPSVPDEAFLSDEDRVRKLLRENGGRMKQVRIVEETGWSKSKVSVLLSEMEEDDVISKLRVGRENVVSLDGHEPEAAKSPFDEEDAEE